jgi:hypothetical protein
MVNDQLPVWVARHPIAWGVVSGLLMGAVGFGLFRSLPLSAAVGLVFGAANWYIWRNNGPAHRWRASLLRRFPPK